jgi:hypothetical protein
MKPIYYRRSLWGFFLLASLSTAPGQNLRINRQNDITKLDITDLSGKDYTLEASSGIMPSAAWTPVMKWTGSGQTSPWYDLDSWKMPFRFYRLRQVDGAGGGPSVTDFRLISQEGKWYELYYHSEAKAVVLILAGHALTNVLSILPNLEQSRTYFGDRGVLFWILLAVPDTERDQVAAQALANEIHFPVLLDPSEQVSRELGAHTAPEAICIRTSDWTVFYRGAIAEAIDRLPQPVSKNYLASALQTSLGGRPILLHETAAHGSSILLAPVAVADYSHEIAPLLQAKCVACHSPGNIAPFAMTNYDVVQTRAQHIKVQVLAGNMPPWHADPHYGNFLDDRSLSPQQLAQLVQWIDAGTPRGEGPDLLQAVPAPPTPWPVELGEPDVVVTIPPQPVAATGEEPYRYIFAQSSVPTNAWLRAAVVRPSNTKVVHHYLVWLGQSTFPQATGIAIYVPGRQPVPLPEGTGVYLPARTWLTFNLHYTPDGQEETDQPELGLYFAAKKPAKELKTQAILNQSFLIPAGASEYEVSQDYTFNQAATIYHLYPHMHLRGARMQFEAFYPNGEHETLLSVPHYVFHWQTIYRLAVPKHLPAHTLIRVTGAYDNSAQNLENPDPTQSILWGDQSWDEMFIGYVEYTEGL